MEAVIPLLAIAIFVIFEGFFSGSEIAIVSLSRIELEKRFKDGKKEAKLLKKLLENPEKFLATTLVGTNLSTVSASTIFTLFVLDKVQFPLFVNHPELAVVLLLTPITLTFGELIPKSLFQKYSNKISFKLAYPVYFFYLVFKPLTFFLMEFARFVSKVAKSEQRYSITKEELFFLLDNVKRLKLDLPERAILKNILRVREKNVGDIYTPLSKVVAVEEKTPVANTVEIFENTGFSKLPVFKSRIDNINSYLSVDSLLEEENLNKRVGEVAKPVLVFPEYMGILEALSRFRKTPSQLAIVVDEYGSTLGILTIEDILEEIVGTIEDEFDLTKQKVRKYGKIVVADGDAEIEEVNRYLRTPLKPSASYETVSGYILSRIRKIPAEGESFRFENKIFRILESDARRIKKVQIIETFHNNF